MAYERLDAKYVAGQVWDEDAIKHIDDSFERVYDDLFDEKIDSSYVLVYKNIDSLLNIKFTSSLGSDGKLIGMWGCVGTPQNFDRVIVPVKAYSKDVINTIEVKILEIPSINDVEAAAWGVTPRPTAWNVLASGTRTIEDLPSDRYSQIEVDLNSAVINEGGKYLFMAVTASAPVYLGLIEHTYEDIEYNPWKYYSYVNSKGNHAHGTAFSGSNPGYDFNSKTVAVFPAHFYKKSDSDSYLTIGTETNDKFYNLTMESLSGSGIFEKKYNPQYLTGSQDLTIYTASNDTSLTSGFTGVLFPIGVVSDTITMSGCMLKVKARKSDDGDTTPITKVWAFLYEIDALPYSAETNTSWNTYNSKLLRTGSIDCNIAVGTAEVLPIYWHEGDFTNTDKKFLMLGYNTDALFNRCFVSSGKRDAVILSELDGVAYDTTVGFDTWYAGNSDKDRSNPTWAPRWKNSKANAWSLIGRTSYLDIGEKMYDIITDGVESSIEDIIGNLTVATAPTSEVCLAKQYDLVVGDTFQLFYEGVIKSFAPLDDGIVVKCAKGAQYPRYYEFTPTEGDVGSYDLTLTTRKLDGTIISSGITKIVVHPKLTNATTPEHLTLLAFGDSLTVNGQWVAEGLRRIYGTDTTVKPQTDGVTNTVTTYGRKTNTVNGFTVSHEGYGGWHWASFLATEVASSNTNGIIVTLSTAHNYNLNTVQKSVWVDNNGLKWELEDFPSATQLKFNRGEGNTGKQSATALPTSLTCSALNLSITPATIVWESGNPFYDENTNSISFANHAAECGASAPQIVACLLTWNGVTPATDFTYTSFIDNHITKATTVLRTIHNDFPDAKIICCGIQLSSLTGGTGYNYGANGTSGDMWSMAFYAFEYNKALEELVTNDEFGEYCYYVDVKGQFDTINNMPYSEKAVNTRSTIKEKIGTNGVHPKPEGYYQIGDAFYRALTKVIPLTMETNTTE